MTYWAELRHFFDWTQSNVNRCLNVCWGAQAALRHFDGVPKHDLPQNACRRFSASEPGSNVSFLRRFSDEFWIPVSRCTEVRRQDLPQGSNIRVLADSDETDLCLVDDLYNLDHVEHDASTLADEYRRDFLAGRRGALSKNYFPHDDCSQEPQNQWRSHTHLLIGNWVDEIYQTTPFDWVAVRRG